MGQTLGYEQLPGHELCAGDRRPGPFSSPLLLSLALRQSLPHRSHLDICMHRCLIPWTDSDWGANLARLFVWGHVFQRPGIREDSC